MPLVTLPSGRNLYYEGGDEGKPLLYIDGTGSDLRTGGGAQLIASLSARGFRTICYDHRGMGRSATLSDNDNPVTWAMGDFADDAAALLAVLGISRCAVVGWSFGGMVAQHLALRHPQVVSSLVLACCTAGGKGEESYPLHELELGGLDARTKAERKIPLLDSRSEVLPEIVQRSMEFDQAQRARNESTPGAIEGERRQLQARAGHDVQATLGSLSSRTLVIAGEFDGIAPLESVRAMASRIPSSVFCMFPGGHLMMKFGDQEGVIWQAVADFYHAHEELEPKEAPPSSFAEAVQGAFSGSAEAFELPGIAWHVERAGEVAAGVSGFTHAAHTAERQPLSLNQRWHWGSCTKALSATVAASLVDAGDVFPDGWDTAVGPLLGLMQTTPEGLGSVTLRQLAAHRGGVCLDLTPEEEGSLQAEFNLLASSVGRPATPMDQRAAFVSKLACKQLAHAPGRGYGYSNAGYVVLSAAAEAAAGQPWETLVERLTLKLGMTTFGFGSPPRDSVGGGAVGHSEDGAVDAADDAAWHHASFSVHSTLSDWARFARLHLKALQGDAEALTCIGVSAASVAILHTPVSPAVPGEFYHGTDEPLDMAMGWKCLWDEPDAGCREAAKASGILWHWGTNFRYNSGAYLRARPPLLMLVALNSGSSLARLASRLAFEGTISAANS